MIKTFNMILVFLWSRMLEGRKRVEYTIVTKWWWKKLLKWVELVYMRNHLLGKLLKITSHR